MLQNFVFLISHYFILIEFQVIDEYTFNLRLLRPTDTQRSDTTGQCRRR